MTTAGNFDATAGSVMLAHPFEPEKHKVVGYQIFEKLDGYRAIYSAKHKKFFSRSGKEFLVPKWFIEDFPDIDMDGEITPGRGKFDMMGLLRRKTGVLEGKFDKEWAQMKYFVFDAPSHPGTFVERDAFLRTHLKKCKHAEILNPIATVKNVEEIFTMLHKIENEGAEGLMLRNPAGLYEQKRSKHLLKVKSMQDAEATVIGHEKGTGKYENILGSFVMKDNKSGVVFNLSGMTDEIRKNPHPIGTVITYKYFEYDKKTGAPRFPVYLRPREEE